MNILRISFLIYSFLIINNLVAQTTILFNGQTAGDTLFVCADQATTLEASGADVFEWSPAELVDVPISPIVNVTTNMSVELIVVGSQVNGTMSSDTIFLQIDNREPDIRLPGNPVICAGSSITLNTGDEQVGFTYAWESISGEPFSSTEASPTVSPNETTSYRVTVTGCETTEQTVTIQVIERPEVSITPSDPSICVGEQVELTATSSLLAEQIVWTLLDGSTIPSSTITARPTETSIYSVAFTYGDNCNMEMAEVTVAVQPNFEFELVTTVDEEESDSTELILDCVLGLTVNSSTGNLTYEWTRDGEKLPETGNTYAETLNTEGAFTYQVVATSANGCTQRDEVSITVRAPRLPDEAPGLVPNVFTPNGDNLNDFFVPYLEKGLMIEELKVYNRWGQCVYNNENGDMGWDGTFENSDAPADVYIYTLTIRLPDTAEQDTFSQRGEVTLLR